MFGGSTDPQQSPLNLGNMFGKQGQQTMLQQQQQQQQQQVHQLRESGTGIVNHIHVHCIIGVSPG